MSEFESTPTFIDLDQAAELYLDLRQSAENLGILLRAYLGEDLFFRRNFTELFPQKSYLQPSLGPMADDPVRGVLLRLAGLANIDELVDRGARQLELNTDRAVLACNMLSLLLQSHYPGWECPDLEPDQASEPDPEPE